MARKKIGHNSTFIVKLAFRHQKETSAFWKGQKKQPSVKSLKLNYNKINLRLGCVLILTLRDLSKRAVAVIYRLDLIKHDKVN